MYSSTLTSTITTFLFYLLITFASTQQVPPSSPPILPTINVSNTFPSTPPTDIRWLIASRGDALDKILPEFCQNNNIPLSLCTRLCGRVIGFYNFYDCECPNFTSEAPENMLGLGGRERSSSRTFYVDGGVAFRGLPPLPDDLQRDAR